MRTKEMWKKMKTKMEAAKMEENKRKSEMIMVIIIIIITTTNCLEMLHQFPHC
jgi:hypothetical protein